MLSVTGREKGSPYLEGSKGSHQLEGRLYLEGIKSVTWKGESRLPGKEKVGYLERIKSVTCKGESQLPGR